MSGEAPLVTKSVYFAAACTVCDYSFKVDDRAPTIADRQRPRDHARRHRHLVEVWERKILEPR